MKPRLNKQHLSVQFLISNVAIITVATLCYLCVDLIGYRSVALLLLATVSILSIYLTLYPVLVAATMSALVWDYFFIPPHFTFHIDSSDDALMLMMYFLIALINGVLTSKVRELENLQLQKDERQHTLKLYKTLFDSISHELRTPIATIVCASDNLLVKDSKVTEENKTELIAEISIAAFRLNRLIDNLLNMQRLESGTLQIKPDWCEINELINSPLNRLKKELSSHQVLVEIQDNFPIIKLDFGLIEQALFNLLHNETLYTPTDSTITIAASYMDDYLMITITDNGKGFSNEDLGRLFTKFYRSSHQTTGGTGLGLSIVKGFVEAHHGEVSAENMIPSGAKFTIKIPTEAFELNDYLDFSDMTVTQNSKHETLSDIYTPKTRIDDSSINGIG